MHRDAVPDLAPGDAAPILAAAKAADAAGIAWNVAKSGPGGTSLLLYEDFEASPFPALLGSAKFDPGAGTFRKTDYSGRGNPPILHRKELLLRADDPRRSDFERLTAEAEAAGLFEPPLSVIGTRSGWRARLQEKNVVLDGGRIVEARSGDGEVRREKTAIRRFGPSQPLSAMLRTGMISAGTSFFDYGCGYGDDIAFLQENGFEASGWDPWHRPEAKRVEADVVALSFVVNVIEDPEERRATAERAWSLSRKGICVAVMHRGAYDVSGHVAMKDGFVSSRGTFQKYFTQDELVEFVRATTGERPVVLGNGMVAAFKDKDLEQQVLSRARSGRAGGDGFRTPAKSRLGEEAEARAAARAKHAGKAAAAVASLVLDIGRMPERNELPPLAAKVVADRVVSFPALLAQAAASLEAGELEAAAEARRQDLVLHFALALVPGMPSYSSLPEPLRRDVRAFFGSLQAVKDEAVRALAASGKPANFAACCSEAAAEGFGTVEEGVFRCAGCVVENLPLGLRIVAGCAEIVQPGLSDADFFEFGPSSGFCKAYRVSDAHALLPKLLEKVVVDIGRSRSRASSLEYRLFYLRSRFMPSWDPALDKQKALDEKLLSSGLVSPDGKGPEGPKLVEMVSAGRKPIG